MLLQVVFYAAAATAVGVRPLYVWTSSKQSLKDLSVSAPVVEAAGWVKDEQNAGAAVTRLPMLVLKAGSKPRNPRHFDAIEGRRSYTQGVEDTFRCSVGCRRHF